MKKLYVVLAAICITALVSCFSPWEGGNGEIRIAFSDRRHSASITAFNNESDITYEITLTGPGGITHTYTYDFAGSNTVSIAVTPGDWSIAIRTVGAPFSAYWDYPALRALGFSETPVTVRAGQSAQAQIAMTPAFEISTPQQMSWVLGESAPPEAILVITGQIGASAPFGISGNITLIPDGNAEIYRESTNTDNIFAIHGGALTLGRGGMSGSIVIDGRDVLGDPLIYIGANGNLFMHDGVTLTGGNTEEWSTTGASGGGGAVYVTTATSDFTMYGGVISGNATQEQGGGVQIWLGTFTINSGTISNNTSAWGGGGVAVLGNGRFTMNSGTISDNTSAWEGGGVAVIGSDGHSTFTMHGGIISGNTSAWEGGGIAVIVLEDGNGNSTFTMYGGRIYGSNAPSGRQNVAELNGHALFVDTGGTASFGGALGMEAIGTSNLTLP